MTAATPGTALVAYVPRPLEHDARPAAKRKPTHPWRAQQGTTADRRAEDRAREAVVPAHARMGVRG